MKKKQRVSIPFLSTLSKRQVTLGMLLCAFLLGLVFSLFLYNTMKRSEEVFLEVTWMSPREALVFWNTKHETVGYVKHGNTRLLGEKQYQTSSVPGNVHVVLIENISDGDHYISLHADSDSSFLWSDPIYIEYTSEELDE